jgi:hypothetical protein
MTKSTVVATRHAVALPTIAPALPRHSGALTSAIRDFINPHPDIGLPQVSPETQAEARAALPALETLCRPATADRVAAWLLPVSSGVGKQITREEFAMRIGPITAALADMPGSVFTVAMQREALRTFKYFPSASEVHALLAPHAREIEAARNALRKIAGANAAAPPMPELTDAQREQISATFWTKWHRMKRETAPEAPPEPRRAIRASHLSGEHLAAFRAQGKGRGA